jgi:alanine racemase
MQSTRGRPTVAEVSLGALRNNLREAQRLVGPSVRVMAVVKADGYGHGAVASARAFLEAGAAVLGTSSVAEAVELRRAGVTAPIVVLGGVFPGEEGDVAAHDLAAGVWSLETVRALVAARAGRPLRLHVKVDTGMTRLGLDLPDVRGFGETVRGMDGVEIEGVYSHFASADAVEAAPAQAQIGRFAEAVESLAAVGVCPPHVHLANSAAVLSQPTAHFSLVRPGLMLYGCAPAPHLAARAALKSALRLRTAVAQVRRVPAGRAVGYGGTYVTSRPSVIATLPIGYADGWSRRYWPGATALVRGQRVPLVGRVSMDSVCADVTDVAGVTHDDVFVLLGAQGDERITASDLARLRGSIPNEVFCDFGPRLVRRPIG